MYRPQVSKDTVKVTLEQVILRLYNRLEQKGYGAFVTSHEILGSLEEELLEYKIEVLKKGSAEAKVRELEDIAIAAIFGIASFVTTTGE